MMKMSFKIIFQLGHFKLEYRYHDTIKKCNDALTSLSKNNPIAMKRLNEKKKLKKF